MSKRKLPPEFAAAVESVHAAREVAFAELREANRLGVTRADLEKYFAAMSQVAADAEQLRRAYFPRRHELFVGSGYAAIFSKTGRVTEIVWRRESGDE